jgi:hypothetical protein
VTTTVFITQCCKRTRQAGRDTLRSLERAAWGLLAAVVLALAPPAVADTAVGPPEVTQLRVERGEDGILLSTSVRFELPQVVEDALAKGIPMFFVAEASVFRDRWYWYDKRVTTAVRHMRLAYQPLTRRWRLQVSANQIGNTGAVLGQTFDSREEALAVVQRISRWRIADLSEVEGDAGHNIEFRFRLDVSQLPRPFQIGAVGQSEWNISVVRNQRLQFEAPR